MAAAAYHLHDFVMHGAVERSDDGGLLVVTSPHQWAYGLELPLHGAPQAPMTTLIELHVREGTVGVGSLTADGGGFFHEIQLVASDEPVTIRVKTGVGDQAGSLVVRNVSTSNKPSRIHIRRLEVEPEAVEDEALPEVTIDPSVFAPFGSWSGTVPAGYSADWTGVFTAAHTWHFPPEMAQVYAQERYQGASFPLEGGELVLDWTPLVQAIAASGDTFRMVALGAGFGRWIVAGAALARKVGKDYRIVGVEAEPQHYVWMQEHVAFNGIDPAKAQLFAAAATGQPGDCWFEVGGDPQSWYGQSVKAAAGADDGDHSYGQNGLLRRTPGMTLTDIVGHLSPIDYMHMDIQGTEAQFLSSAPPMLDAHVKMVNIGTHSIEIENDLRKLFNGLGWTSVFDVSLGSTRSIRAGDAFFPEVEFGDGVQVWVNPRL